MSEDQAVKFDGTKGTKQDRGRRTREQTNQQIHVPEESGLGPVELCENLGALLLFLEGACGGDRFGHLSRHQFHVTSAIIDMTNQIS